MYMSTCKCTNHMNYTMLMINLLVKQIIDVVVCNFVLHLDANFSVSRICKQTHLVWSQKFFVQNKPNGPILSIWADACSPVPSSNSGSNYLRLFLVWLLVVTSQLQRIYLITISSFINFTPHYENWGLGTYLKPQLFQVLCSHVIFNFCPGYPFNFKYHA